MDYEALVAKFGQAQADLIMDQFAADPRLTQFTPQKLNMMAQDAAYAARHGSITETPMSIGRFIEDGWVSGLMQIGIGEDTARDIGQGVRSVSSFMPITGEIEGFESAEDAFYRADTALEQENYAAASINFGLGAVEGALSIIGAAGITKAPVSFVRNATRKAANSMLDHIAAAPRTLNTPNFKNFQLEPSSAVEKAAQEYARRSGVPYYPPNEYAPVNKDFAREVADEYALRGHDPSNPLVRAAYGDLRDELYGQYDTLLDQGYSFKFNDKPYFDSPWEALIDMQQNKQLKVFPTNIGFGSNPNFDAADNPLLGLSPFKFDGVPAYDNDIFRAVHDAYGHAKSGVGFRARGEENAYLSHAGTFSPNARKALAQETRGQNSWVNFNPVSGKANQTALGENVVFADQNSNILPNFMTEYNTPQQHLRSQEWQKRLEAGDHDFGSALNPDGTITISHYTNKDIKDGRIDPNYYGKGSNLRLSRSERNRSHDDKFVKRSFWGVTSDKNPYVKENLGDVEYTTTVDGSMIYDVKRDPEGLWNNAKNVTEAENNVWRAGYSGYNAVDDRLGSTIQLFDPTSATKKSFTPPSVKTSGLEGVAGKVNINYNKMTKPQLDPLGYQKTKMSIPMSEVIPQQESMNNLLDRIAIGIEDMQGKRVMPMYWDRSVGDVKLTGIKSPLGIYDQFDQPVFPDAGVDFMRGQAHQADGSLIASKDSIVSTLTNRAKLEAKRTGDEVYPMTVSMANDGADFTAFESEVMAEMMKFAPVTKKAAKTFDKEMKILDPNWIGVQHPKLRDYIKKSSPDIRKAFIKKIDTAPHQAENFPPSAMARYSVTAPDQRTLPAGMAGLGIGKLDGGIVKNPTFEHSTYKTQGTGDYTGSMTPVPQGLIWKDEYARMDNLKTKAGKPYSEANKTYALKTILPTQKIDQEIVDNVMEWIARNRQ
ncbi:hypothetical protein [Cycloclasticus pugetii]|uniref:hypothetical protein n=1 Tax=Cycloclasticus pugetii TaxID=34068 RepID=UPI0024098D82|nr:hypothetical protein [Cycloclasticus pugetii]MDF1830675.1 hypothetical protein [Cycloclasticus pugetii]